jgi:hypothetical protein
MRMIEMAVDSLHDRMRLVNSDVEISTFQSWAVASAKTEKK